MPNGPNGHVTLRILGPLEVHDPSGREIRSVLAQPKRLSLLSYLALTSLDQYRQRDTIVALFWPEFDQARARAALRQALSWLRHELGSAVLITRGEEEIGVAANGLWCDAVAFDDAIAARDHERALGLYRGQLLEGVFATGSDAEFEHWLDAERTRRHQQATRAAIAVAEREGAAGRMAAAVDWANRAAFLSPNDEDVHRRRIRLLAASGDRAGALVAHAAFAERLAADYGTRPSAETARVIAEVQASDRVASPEAAALVPLRSFRDAIPDGIARQSPPEGERSAKPPASGLDGETVAAAQPMGRRSATRSRSVRNVTVLAVGIAIAAGLIKTAASAFREAMPLDPNVVAVVPFDVFEPSLAVWREGMTTLLSSSLDGAGPLRTIPAMQIVHRWTGKAERESATRLARATGAAVVIYGTLLLSGADSVRASATVLDVGSGGTSDIEVRDRVDRIARVCDSLTIAVLRQLGRTRPLTAVRGGGIASAPLPVLKAYLLGEQHYRHGRPDSALVYFERAVNLDSTFALAWRGRMSALTMIRPEADSVVRDYGLRAGALNHGLAPRESLLVVADSLYQALTLQSGDPGGSQGARLHATLESFTRRYPEDAEGWFLLGRARLYVPLMEQSLDQTLDAIDHAIQLDSLFVPAMHGHEPIELALRLGDRARALRHLRAKVSRQAWPAENDGIRFALRVLENQRDGYRSLGRWADTVGVKSAIFAIRALQWWPDSAEAAVQLARALIRRSDVRRVAASTLGDIPEWQLDATRVLLLRGHVREASQLLQYHANGWGGGFFGGVPAESAAAMFQRRQRHLGLPWWAVRRDTVSLRRQRASFDSLSRFSSGEPSVFARGVGVSVLAVRRRMRYDRERTDAYLALAQGDTSVAIDKLVWLVEAACDGCSWTRQTMDIYAAARLLEARGRGREALQWLAHDEITVPVPVYDIAKQVVRGRIAEGLGQHETARSAYRRVAAMWANADPELQPMVAEANAGLRRLRP